MEEKTNNLDKKIIQYEKEFSGLTDDEVRILAYRKIYDIKKNEEIFLDEEMNKLRERDNSETILAIILASNHRVSFLSALILNCYSDTLKNNYNNYRQVLTSYQKVLENYKKLAEELKIYDSLNLSHLFSFLLWNGYFSATKDHHYNPNDRLMILGMNSFDVFKGRGVCLAYAELLTNYLNACNREAALLSCVVPTKKGAIKINYCPEIERKYSLGKINHSIISSFMFF